MLDSGDVALVSGAGPDCEEPASADPAADGAGAEAEEAAAVVEVLEDDENEAEVAVTWLSRVKLFVSACLEELM